MLRCLAGVELGLLREFLYGKLGKEGRRAYSPALSPHVAGEFRDESQILKEQRKAREEQELASKTGGKKGQ